MNRAYEIYNPDALPALAGEGPDRMVFCIKHAKKCKKMIKRGATTLYWKKREWTDEPCAWCENPEEFEDDY